MTKQRFFVVALLLFMVNNLFAQTIVPASIFGNNMVIQQGIKAPIWGMAKPNEMVTISIAGKKEKSKADAMGNWMLKLPKMKSGGPFKMSISTTTDSVVYPSVYVGEVWLAGGQSNMQFTLPECKNAGAEIAAANYPDISFFTVKLNMSATPLNQVNGEWLPCTPQNAKTYSAAAYFFARELHKDKNVPVGIIASSWGGTPAEAWTSSESLINYPVFKDSVIRYQNLQEDWSKLYSNFIAARDSIKKLNNGTKPPQLPAQKNYPTSLYNAMIAPLVPYAIKGVIWYQGENNAPRALQYRTLFPLLITDWRTKWKNESMPFIFVQLANYKAKNEQPVFKDDWASLREAQTMTLSLPKTGMALAIDIGLANNIHPTNKQDVGKRLYLAAKHIAYNESVVYSGPQFVNMNIKESMIELSFKHEGAGLKSNCDTLKGFAVAGEDKKFYWATAQIEGNKVIVTCKDVTKPVSVRYAWASNPDACLFNKEGLPAIPFRTDDW